MADDKKDIIDESDEVEFNLMEDIRCLKEELAAAISTANMRTALNSVDTTSTKTTISVIDIDFDDIVQETFRGLYRGSKARLVVMPKTSATIDSTQTTITSNS